MASALSSVMVVAQESKQDSTRVIDEVLISAVRAKETLPVTFSNVSKKEIKQKNFGQQLPLLINHLPNVVSYSEDGAGFGSTALFIRGNDLQRTNVTINGIPYNDSESLGVYWYNLSDFAGSAESIQVQRGVGTSTNGTGAFGASLNILTDAISEKAYGELSNYYGSYNSHKHSLKFSTGKMNDRFEISGRFSKINSDGYIDRASSDLKSYFLQGAYSHKNTLIKALVFGGVQKTYLTYKGIDADMLKKIVDIILRERIMTVLVIFIFIIMKPIITNKTTLNYIGLRSGIPIGLLILPYTIPKVKAIGSKWTIGEMRMVIS